jgi:hypothetical protein
MSTGQAPVTFRLKAFGLHLLGSAIALALILGTLYLGWYHGPGWYLSDVSHVVAVLVLVDVVIGPSLTLVIADVMKPRRELARDIAIIAAVQLAALAYGSSALWNGRPLYYAFSVNCLSLVQAQDIDADALKLARAQGAPLVPHWYSLPRWIWAPLPQDPTKSAKIVESATLGGVDVTAMPQYYKPWNDGLPELKTQLKKVDEIGFFSRKERETLKERMRAAGLAVDLPDGIPLTGRKRPMLAVIDPSTLNIRAIIEAT